MTHCAPGMVPHPRFSAHISSISANFGWKNSRMALHPSLYKPILLFFRPHVYRFHLLYTSFCAGPVLLLSWLWIICSPHYFPGAHDPALRIASFKLQAGYQTAKLVSLHSFGVWFFKATWLGLKIVGKRNSSISYPPPFTGPKTLRM